MTDRTAAVSGGKVVAWCELTPGGKIAFFDGKPMVMVGPVGNEHHTTPLVLQSDLDAAIARAEAAEAKLAWLRGHARQNTAYDLYGGGAYWSIGFHSDDLRLDFDAAIAAQQAEGVSS